MNLRFRTRGLGLAVTSAVALVVLSGLLLAAAPAKLPKPDYNAAGELLRPEGYREWVYVGTPLTPNDQNPPEAAFPEFHNVYIHPADFAVYRKTGKFPDGTVIVKELVLVGSKKAVSGNGYFMGEFIGLEATVKDSKRFKAEPGNWAYFSFGHSYPLANSAAAFPTAACNACHAASAADDFVFTQYYPVLRSARSEKKGGGQAMNAESEEFQAIRSSMGGKVEQALKASAPTGEVASAVPTDSAALFAYLQSGAYKDFAAKESKLHSSRGPHTRLGLPVRVFLDPLLDASLAAGNPSHPAGSSVVKEMFDDNNKLSGWAVMVKTSADSARGDGWYWYEVTDTKDGSKPVAAGNGVPLCAGCHFMGDDFVLTKHPLS